MFLLQRYTDFSQSRSNVWNCWRASSEEGIEQNLKELALQDHLLMPNSIL